MFKCKTTENNLKIQYDDACSFKETAETYLHALKITNIYLLLMGPSTRTATINNFIFRLF